MELPPEDFESSASTSFTTPARDETYTNPPGLSSKNRLLKKLKIFEIIFLSPSVRHSEHREESCQTPQDPLRGESILFKYFDPSLSSG